MGVINSFEWLSMCLYKPVSLPHIPKLRNALLLLSVSVMLAGLEAVPVLDDQEVTIFKNGSLLLVLRPRLRTPSHERFPHVQVATLEWLFSHEWDSDGTVVAKVLHLFCHQARLMYAISRS
jgi:hypothetical protein